MKCVVWSVKTVKCEVRSGARAWRARTRGLGWRTAHASSIDEKGLIYIFKATSAPPRAGTTGIKSRYQRGKKWNKCMKCGLSTQRL